VRCRDQLQRAVPEGTAGLGDAAGPAERAFVDCCALYCRCCALYFLPSRASAGDTATAVTAIAAAARAMRLGRIIGWSSCKSHALYYGMFRRHLPDAANIGLNLHRITAFGECFGAAAAGRLIPKRRQTARVGLRVYTLQMCVFPSANKEFWEV
jgi:hypothetical protein